MSKQAQQVPASQQVPLSQQVPASQRVPEVPASQQVKLHPDDGRDTAETIAKRVRKAKAKAAPKKKSTKRR